MSQEPERVDYRKQLKLLYSARSATPAVVDVPALGFLMIDGIGDPNTAPAFEDAVAALYSASYALKFALKRSARPTDYAVMPLEGLWWSGDMTDFSAGHRDAWRWTLMIMQPPQITPSQVASTIAELRHKKPLRALDLLRFESFEEGLSAQVMHLGPFALERATIETLHAFIAAQGGTPTGKHHEIYLSDMRRTAPAKLKTILRQPFSW